VRDLDEVPPLDDADLDCMNELRDVLARHGRLGRFALQLVHKHFDLGPHEVLVETSDPATREQRLRVQPRDRLATLDAVPTAWLLGADGPAVVCVCANRGGEGHRGRHEST
jgi:hypothetical protein